jgi:hypothetical protein
MRWGIKGLREKSGSHKTPIWKVWPLLLPGRIKGKAHKLDEVVFHMNTEDYMQPWKITSNDHRFEMDFTPVLDRQSRFDFKLLKSVQHQVFGHFTGFVTLDDGSVLKINKFFGFAEDVLNWW